jgi:hypothetical protein
VPGQIWVGDVELWRAGTVRRSSADTSLLATSSTTQANAPIGDSEVAIRLAEEREASSALGVCGVRRLFRHHGSVRTR